MNYETITSNCNVCTWLGQSQVGCTKLGGCTSITQVTSTATVTVTPTQTVVVTPAEMADCVFRDVVVAWAFEVYNIQNWATDGGKALHKQDTKLPTQSWRMPTSICPSLSRMAASSAPLCRPAGPSSRARGWREAWQLTMRMTTRITSLWTTWTQKSACASPSAARRSTRPYRPARCRSHTHTLQTNLATPTRPCRGPATMGL